MPLFEIQPARGERFEQVASFSRSEDSTPLSIDDTTGATGQMTVTLDRQQMASGRRMRPADWKRLKNQPVSIVTAGGTQAVGVVSHVSGGDAATNVAIDSVAVRLAVVRSVKPVTGMLSAVLTAWLARCGLNADALEVDDGLNDALGVLQVTGFEANVWTRLKALASALGFEVVVVGNQVVARPRRTLVLSPARIASTSWDVDDSNVVHSLTVNYYTPTEIIPGDTTIDYSRQDVTDAETVNSDTKDAQSPYNRLPPGWAKREV